VNSSSRRPLPDNTQHSQLTDIHAAGGIRTHNPSKQAAVEPCPRPRGHSVIPYLWQIILHSGGVPKFSIAEEKARRVKCSPNTGTGHICLYAFLIIVTDTSSSVTCFYYRLAHWIVEKINKPLTISENWFVGCR